jgi:hypothetical protein
MSWPGHALGLDPRVDPAIPPQDPKRWNLLSWMAASEGGHDNKAIPNNFDAL